MKITWIISIGLFFNSCSGGGGGGGSASVDSWSDTYASGFAVASPLSVSAKKSINETLTGDEPVQEKIELLDSIAEGDAVGGCNITLPTLNGLSGNATCYGPAVSYTDHQDGSGDDGTLPTGDTGLWEAAVSGEACASAQINKLMTNVSRYIDAALMLQASFVCLLNENDVAFTDSADITSQFQTSLQVNNTGATVTSATVSVDGSISTFTIVGTSDGSDDFDITLKIKMISDANYEGRIYGYFTSANVDAFSTSFTKTGNDLKVRMTAGSWNSGSIGSIFNSSGEIIQDDTFTMSMNNAIINMNSSTGVGNISYAWQAGSGDSNTRAFNAYVEDNAGTLGGCGFFGFGDDFDLDDTLNTNTINGFICNWAGPGNNHSSSTNGKSQKQCFAESGGIMAEDTGSRAITYAPTNSCNDTDGAFIYAWPTHSGDAATNNLITLSSDVDYDDYSAPTAPTLSSGL